jgi:4,5-DOPA dioxygenase extradiol
MDRKHFLKLMGLLPLMGASMKLNALSSFSEKLENTDTMPLLFLGHGNPMHAIQQDEFSEGWLKTAKSLPVPKAILCISAHWETAGTYVTAMPKPKTIHDFGGFPQELFNVQYPAPGSPELAMQAKELIKKTSVEMDHEWGLDHGTWSVIKHMYPNADIPVIQMSLDYRKDAAWHYALAKELAALRQKGILIVGSGNIVHNLRLADWNAKGGSDWAVVANEKMKQHILGNDHQPLINYSSMGKEVNMAIPSPDHYLPLLYILGLKTEKEQVSLFNDKTELGSISMTSVKISNV